MARRHWACVLVSCALLTAAPIAQNRPPRNPAGAQPQQPPKDDARTEKLKAEAWAKADTALCRGFRNLYPGFTTNGA